MTEILSGIHSPEQIGALLMSLHYRPAKTPVLTGFAKSLLQKSIPVKSNANELLMDVCGTGGDMQGTFNISTTVAFVVASAGIPVAKHGNRAVSSRSGSFDVLEKLQVPFADTPAEVLTDLRDFGLSFLYAPSFHPSLRKLAPFRKALGVRTVLNVLGPLLNPARVRRQLIGVYSPDLLRPVAETLRELGCQEAFVVSGEDGADEVSLTGKTQALHLKKGEIYPVVLSPENFDLGRVNSQELLGGTSLQNAQILESILAGESGARTNAVLINAAVALSIIEESADLKSSMKIARSALKDKKAYKLLKQMQSHDELKATL